MKYITVCDLQLSVFRLIFLCTPMIQGQTIVEEFDNPCTSAMTCGECIQTAPVCAWCGAEVYSREFTRCDKLENVMRHCNTSTITNPASSFQIIRDEALTSGDTSQPPVQVKPQEVELTLRPNEPKKFKLKFQQQANYPVDLYFLLDLSYGMRRQIEASERLITLGTDISVSMSNITNNFRLGFGTFVDKLLMPYTAWTDDMLQVRCPLHKSKGHCEYPHNFKNRLSIGLNQNSFGSLMRKALENVSQSLDDLEGGLDGLIQALDCDVIGWRSESRRIVVYSSNSAFHLAGNGKLGGATKQNKLTCYLTKDGYYAGDKVYDYPSVSQIAQKLREKNANVIFAVMSDVAQIYETLTNFLDGAIVGKLEKDSKSIVKLIEDKYYELRSRIEFRHSQATNIKVKLRSKCKGAIMRETHVCENLEIMESVEFEVMVTVSKDICQGQTGSLKKKIVMNAVGLNEAIVVQFNVQCGCECEQSTQETMNSAKCTFGNGTFECGICTCNPGRFGRLCECDETEISKEKSLDFCKADRNDSLICSGNGECICGVCECFPLLGETSLLYAGRYCDCDNYNCLLGENKLLCGGPSNGICQCGTCDCLPGWSGRSCECNTNKDSCMANNGELCNGAGTCQCGRCVCNSTSGLFGPTCEDCLSCPSQCNEYADCAQCFGFQSGSYGKEECENNCKDFKMRKVEDLLSGDGIRLCEGTDSDTCTFYFAYEYTSTNYATLTIQETKRCPKELPLAAIIGGTISAVIFIPLALICIFIFLRNLKDREEYAKFIRHRAQARWDTGANPIYKEPTTTFTNITYRGASPGNTNPSHEETHNI